MERTKLAKEYPSRSGFLAGSLAAGAAMVGMLMLGAISERPTLAETIAEGIAGRTPIHLVESMTSAFGSDAKHLLFAGTLIGHIAVGGLVGFYAQRLVWNLWQFLRAVAALIALVGLVGLPIIGAGLFGTTARAGPYGTVVSLAVTGTLFLIAYQACERFLNPSGTFAAEDAASRRALLRNGSLAIIGLVVGVSAFRWLAVRLTPSAVSTALSSQVAETNLAIASGDLSKALASGIPGLSPEITPNDKFYVVSKNVFRDPVVSEQTWRMEVTGLVAKPMVLTYDGLRRLPSATQYLTLQCISNEVGGELIGNAEWRGIWLIDLLREAGVRPGTVDVVFRAADDYADSIPIAKALQPGTMLAYEMNGEMLPQIHGYPARLLVPDIYGMKNVKWVTAIEVVGYDFKGYWQTRGWDDSAIMHTTSRIDFPKNNSFLRAGPNYAGGIALAGQRGISGVEVSADGGRTWAPATIKTALGPNTWVLWLYGWDMPEGVEGTRLLVRSTDGAGGAQSSLVKETIPDGASGYHAIGVRLASN
ncbi:MAG: oxidoreductase molybdopterin binding protein [Chloroflexi bacterium]|nr:oxidoreductase molybdopterin binding protein [Chloroflexota bacterium]